MGWSASISLAKGLQKVIEQNSSEEYIFVNSPIRLLII